MGSGLLILPGIAVDFSLASVSFVFFVPFFGGVLRVTSVLEDSSPEVESDSVDVWFVDDVLELFAESLWKEYEEFFWGGRDLGGLELVFCTVLPGAVSGSEIVFFSSFRSWPPPATAVVLRSNEFSLPVSRCVRFFVEICGAVDVGDGTTAFFPFFSPSGLVGIFWSWDVRSWF